MVQKRDEETQSQSDAPSNSLRSVLPVWYPITNASDTPRRETFNDVPRQASSSECALLNSVDAGHGYLTTRLSGRLESPLLDHRLVHVSYPFMNIVTYCPSQKKVTPTVPVSCQPPKTAPRSEAGSANIPDETKAEASGAQNNVEVRVYFVPLAPGLTVILAARSWRTIVVQR